MNYNNLYASAIGAAKPTFERLFDALISQVSLKYKTILQKDREHFWKYLERTSERFSKIRPVGFREHLDFNKVYIPLTIETHGKQECEIFVNDIPVDLLSSQKRILIVDNAGMGKSTLSKRMFLGAFENGGCGIPLFVELRHLSKDNDVMQEVLKQIGNLSSEFDEKLLTVLLEKGGFILFLDGYDEISLNDKEEVTRSLQEFIDKSSNNTFVLTSREDEALAGFQTFNQYSIKRLEEDEAYQLLSNLDNGGEKSQMLIQKLKKEELSGVKEFLVNPLLVTLLYTAFDYDPTLPTKKHLFYDQVFQAFFQQHDNSKGDCYVHDKKSKLAKDDFERILRCIGFASVMNHKVEFERSEILKVIKIAKGKCNLSNFQESDYLDDLVQSVPLFSKEGHSYKWSHKSLAEYFAVEYIAMDSMDQEQTIVEKLYFNEKEQNMNLFDLYFDIKPAGFNRYLLLPCLEDIKNEDLSESESMEKIIFCTKMIGQSLLFPQKGTKIDKRKYNPVYVPPKLRLRNHQIFSKPNERKKWWTLLNIMVNKQYLFMKPSTQYGEPRRLSEIDELPDLSLYLKTNSDKLLCIDSSNVMDYRDSVIRDMNKLFPWGTRLVYLTKEACEESIKSINKEINDNKDLSGWNI